MQTQSVASLRAHAEAARAEYAKAFFVKLFARWSTGQGHVVTNA
ncbi:hypothetical protein AAFO90_22310 [Phaeobacter sp. CAU 1743]